MPNYKAIASKAAKALAESRKKAMVVAEEMLKAQKKLVPKYAAQQAAEFRMNLQPGVKAMEQAIPGMPSLHNAYDVVYNGTKAYGTEGASLSEKLWAEHPRALAAIEKAQAPRFEVSRQGSRTSTEATRKGMGLEKYGPIDPRISDSSEWFHMGSGGEPPFQKYPVKLMQSRIPQKHQRYAGFSTHEQKRVDKLSNSVKEALHLDELDPKTRMQQSYLMKGAGPHTAAHELGHDVRSGMGRTENFNTESGGKIPWEYSPEEMRAESFANAMGFREPWAQMNFHKAISEQGPKELKKVQSLLSSAEKPKGHYGGTDVVINGDWGGKKLPASRAERDEAAKKAQRLIDASRAALNNQEYKLLKPHLKKALNDRIPGLRYGLAIGALGGADAALEE